MPPSRAARERLATLRRVGGAPALVRVELSFGCFSLAETATWLAMLVYAFDRGGAGEAGLVSVGSLITAVLLAPVAASVGDRAPPHRALAIGYVAQSVTMALAAAAMWAERPMLAYGAAFLVAGAVTSTRPVVGSLLPAITHRPADLVAANVVLTTMANAGTFAGPLVAAVLLTVGPHLVFATFAVALGVAALAASRLRLDALPADIAPAADEPAVSLRRRILGGVGALAREPELRLLIFVMSMPAATVGVVDVLVVAVADGRLDGTNVGILGSAVGAGAVIGALATNELSARPRLAPYLVVGAIACGGPLAVVATTSSPTVAVVGLIVVGMGESVLLVLSTVALQRLAPERVLARIFGINESMQMLSMAVGAAAFSVLVSSMSMRSAMIVVAGVVVACVTGAAWRLTARGADIAPPPARIVDRLHADPIFAPLDVRAIERLAAGATTVTVPARTTIVVQGERGDGYYLVVSGELEATVDGEHRRSLGPGDAFGEVALLRDVPRTASVISRSEAEVLVVERAVFVAAVTGHPRSAATAEELTQRYVGPVPRPADRR